MKRLWLNIALLGCLSMAVIGFAPEESSATAPVFCVNCGTETTQLWSKLTMVKQLATQAQQLQTQLNSYQMMVTNTKTLPSQLWGEAMQDFQQLTGLMQQSKALAYSAQNLGGQFASRYGSYNSYLNKKMGTNDWQNKYAQWSKESSDNTLYAMKGLGLQARQMQNEQLAMQRVQAMANSASGQMQALQVANMMASQNTDQLIKLRELMMTQVQMQANYLAQQQDKQAAQDAATRQYLKTYQPKLGGKTMMDY
jgi:P-type conjugative transfer protein TrbJ